MYNNNTPAVSSITLGQNLLYAKSINSIALRTEVVHLSALPNWQITLQLRKTIESVWKWSWSFFTRIWKWRTRRLQIMLSFISCTSCTYVLLARDGCFTSCNGLFRLSIVGERKRKEMLVTWVLSDSNWIIRNEWIND